MRGRVNASSRKCASILYTFLLFPLSLFFFFSQCFPLVFLFRPLVDAGVSALGEKEKQRKKEREKNKTRTKHKKYGKTHSLSYPAENVSGSQQTTRQASGGGGAGEGKKGDWSIAFERIPPSPLPPRELFRIPLLFIIMFDRNIALTWWARACTYIPLCRVGGGVKL